MELEEILAGIIEDCRYETLAIDAHIRAGRLFMELTHDQRTLLCQELGIECNCLSFGSYVTAVMDGYLKKDYEHVG